jgi:prepilin-type N-terminal cleavage/methylation domain-containing protein
MRAAMRNLGRLKSRRGMTVVEVMVAVMILSVGLLGLASTAAVVTRLMAGGAQQTIAANVAQSRFEALQGRQCSAITSDSALTRGMREVWSVVPLTRADDVTVTVRFNTRRGMRLRSYRSMIPC